MIPIKQIVMMSLFAPYHSNAVILLFQMKSTLCCMQKKYHISHQGIDFVPWQLIKSSYQPSKNLLWSLHIVLYSCCCGTDFLLWKRNLSYLRNWSFSNYVCPKRTKDRQKRSALVLQNSLRFGSIQIVKSFSTKSILVFSSIKCFWTTILLEGCFW